MGRRPNTEQRREQIATALMGVIVRKGYSGASIQDIAQEAGLTPGLIHYHFESKQEILITLFSRLEALVNRRMEAGVRKLGKASPLAALDALIDAFLALDDTADRLAVNCWTMISAEAVYNHALGRAFRKVVHAQLRQIEEYLQLAFGGKARRSKVQAGPAATLAARHWSIPLACQA